MLTLAVEFMLDEREKSGRYLIGEFKLFHSGFTDVLVEK